MANAFACRSASRWPGRLGWFSNRFLVLAVVGEVAMLGGFLYFRPLAGVLGQAPPGRTGFLIALLAAPATAAPGITLREYPVPAGSHPHDVAPARDGGVWYTAQASGELGWLDPRTGKTRHTQLGGVLTVFALP